jgi:hypothetical protein
MIAGQAHHLRFVTMKTIRHGCASERMDLVKTNLQCRRRSKPNAGDVLEVQYSSYLTFRRKLAVPNDEH